jgi:hypothetical protein
MVVYRSLLLCAGIGPSAHKVGVGLESLMKYAQKRQLCRAARL